MKTPCWPGSNLGALTQATSRESGKRRTILFLLSFGPLRTDWTCSTASCQLALCPQGGIGAPDTAPALREPCCKPPPSAQGQGANRRSTPPAHIARHTGAADVSPASAVLGVP